MKKIGPGVTEEKLFKGVDGQTDNGWQVITIAHPEPCSGELCFFVCVEVLRLSQPNGVMSSAVSLLGRFSPLSG